MMDYRYCVDGPGVTRLIEQPEYDHDGTTCNENTGTGQRFGPSIFYVQDTPIEPGTTSECVGLTRDPQYSA